MFNLNSINLYIILANSMTFLKTDLYYTLTILSNKPNLKENSISQYRLKSIKMLEWKSMIYLLISYIAEPILIILLLVYSIILNWR